MGRLEAPDPKGSTEFWSKLWSKPVEYNRDSEWLKKVKEKLRDTPKQENVIITAEELKQARMFNWKAAGQRPSTSIFATQSTSQTQTTSTRVCECWSSTYMDSRRMHSTHERQEQLNSYRLIACIPLMWKLLTSIFSEAMYGHLSCQELLPNEQKGFRKHSRGTKDQLLMDKAILMNG